MNYKLFLAGILCIVPSIAFAADPSVQSFTSNSTSLGSGQVASFSWSIADGGGYSFVIPCTQGMKFKKADGSILYCDTPITSVSTATDTIDLTVWNLSGFTKSFTARITPKDATGADVSSARKDIAISVTPVSKPIETMTGTTTIDSLVPYTLSWSSSIIDGANLSISCASTINATSSSYTKGFLPCNTPIFASDLAASGSLTLSFNNSAPTAKDITLTLLPAMAPGVYNGAQTESLTVSVETNISPNPITTSFTASSTLGRVLTNATTTLLWATEKSSGANLRTSCNANIITTITTGDATSTPKCNALAFDTSLPASGSASISFENKSYTNEPITIMLVPERRAGGFDATRGKELSFIVLPKGASLPVVAPQPSTTTLPPPTVPQSSTSVAKILFTKYLGRGSSNAEVRALQEFLAKDATLYPEGSVTGYFGPATERAVKRLQIKYGLGNIGTPGFGGVGPKTRALLNSLVK